MATPDTPRPPRAQADGVDSPPAGLTAGSIGLVTLVSILVVSGLFLISATSLDETADKLWPRAEATAENDAEQPAAIDVSTAPGAAGTPGAGAGTSTEAPTEPKVPSWSLLQVSEAIQTAADQSTRLIAEGRSEIPEFKALSSSDTVRADRARRQWQAWTRIWRNRVAVVAKILPPTGDCAVHAAMEPACAALRETVEQLDAVAEQQDLESAEARFAAAEIALDRYLNPPEPELPEDEPAGEQADEDRTEEENADESGDA